MIYIFLDVAFKKSNRNSSFGFILFSKRKLCGVRLLKAIYTTTKYGYANVVTASEKSESGQ